MQRQLTPTELTLVQNAIQFYEWDKLCNYVNERDIECQRCVMKMIFDLNRTQANYYLNYMIKFGAQEFIETVSNPAVEPNSKRWIISATISQNNDIHPNDQTVCMSAIADRIFIHLRESADKPRTFKNILRILPTAMNEYNVLHLLKRLIREFQNETESIYLEAIEDILNKYSVGSAQVIEVLSDPYLSIDNKNLCKYLLLLLNRIDQHHRRYAAYELYKQLLTATPDERPQRIIAKQKELSKNIPVNLNQFLIDTILQEDEIAFLIKYYIDNPSFSYGASLNTRILSCEVGLITQYLNASHTPLPHAHDFADYLINLLANKNADLVAVLRFLTQRPDFVFTCYYYSDFLLKLLYSGNDECIGVMLINTKIFETLMHYYELNGDDGLASELRGYLMPAIIAWYMVAGDEYANRAYQLLNSVPENERKRIINFKLPPPISSEAQSLRQLVVATGDRRMIDLIGGINQQFVRTQNGELTFFLPAAFNGGWMSRAQAKARVAFAERSSRGLSYRGDASDAVRNLAQSAASNFTEELKLKHHTHLGNAKRILESNRVLTGYALRYHPVFGQASNGLLIDNIYKGHPKLAYIHFTLVMPSAEVRDTSISEYVSQPDTKQAHFIFDMQRLLQENPHIRDSHIILGPISPIDDDEKSFKLTDKFTLVSNPNHYQEGMGMTMINLGQSQDPLVAIYQKLFELVFEILIPQITDKSLRAKVIHRLTTPVAPDDFELAKNLINLLHLEWLLPCCIPLKLAYVDEIRYGDQTNDFFQLYQVLNDKNTSEADKLAAVNNFPNIGQFPFVIDHALTIAAKMNHRYMITELMKLSKIIKPIKPYRQIYQSKAVYELKSLIQLILEDTKDNVIVHYDENNLTITANVTIDSNRNGIHHAQIAHLHRALRISDVMGKNALNLKLDESVTIRLGEDEKFKSLEDVRDAALTYIITTLLTSQQNTQYFQKQGTFHPITGKGAVNGTVALMRSRLYSEQDGKFIPYHIAVSVNTVSDQVKISSDNANTIDFIIVSIKNVLNISRESIQIDDKGIITIKISVHDLIAKFYQHVIFYEGINVFTDDGRLLVAERSGHGLASAGGHHGNIFSRNDIANGLSEFNLQFIDPKKAENNTKLYFVETTLKTGIYIATLSDLMPAATLSDNRLFQADPDEFVVNSEAALSLTDMRGKKFRDVMPLAELCEYQLALLKRSLETNYPDVTTHIALNIDKEVNHTKLNGVNYKLPGDHFGTVYMTVEGDITNELRQVFEQLGAKTSHSTNKHVFIFEESPIKIAQEIKKLKNNINLKC